MRLADISGGLVKALTGIDLSQGIVPALLGRDNIIGGLAGQTGVEIDPSGMIKIPGMSPFPVAEPEPENILMPFRKGSNDFDQLRGRPPSPYAYTHGFADFDVYGMPTYDLPGGEITPQEMDDINRKYPIGGTSY
tara:strand:+ start:116 stop:520 length:405 start_codon:yes stop_codon:yes gene_type:complete